jgi:PilZ domain
MNIRPNFLGLFAALLHRQRNAPSTLQSAPKPNPASESNSVPVERRAAPRRYGDPVEVRLRSYEHADPACGPTGWVRDRSQHGLALTTEKPLDIGSWLRVRPTNVPDDVGWVDVMVRHCRPQGSRSIVGCNFVEAPPRELLLLFR